MPVFIHVNIYYTGPAERSEGGWGIAADYATGEQLSKEQREELEKRLDNGRSQLPSLVSAAYRHVVVSGPKRELRAWDMGAQAYDTSRTLSQRVWDTLKSEEKLLAFLSHAIEAIHGIKLSVALQPEASASPIGIY